MLRAGSSEKGFEGVATVPTPAERYRDLITRVLHASESPDEQDAGLKALGGGLLETTARADAIQRYIEWGCVGARVDGTRDCRAEVLEARMAIARIAGVPAARATDHVAA
jgi:hypothetical protein